MIKQQDIVRLFTGDVVARNYDIAKPDKVVTDERDMVLKGV